MSSVAPEAFDRAASMDELLKLLEDAKMQNGWAKPEPSMYPKPKRPFVPAHWPYRPAKAALNAAGRFVNTELAERRNLILANPIPGNVYPTVQTLVTAYQLVKAGEAARSHRHTANALRLVLDTGPKTYTIVAGEKIPMEPGDVLLTPNWLWHGHSNEGDADAYWIDFLDVPLVHLLGPMFFEQHPDELEKTDIIARHSPYRFTWADTQKRLDGVAERTPGCKRVSLGEPAMASIALHVTRLDPGAKLDNDATTLNSIYAVMDGAVTATVDDEVFECGRGDVIAVPSSCASLFEAKGARSHLLRVSDAPVLKFLNWLRPIEAVNSKR
ncbi:MAG: hypothetical protein RLZ98_704 [Pseudomonadota bacterium]